MADLPEVLPAHAQKRRAVELRVAADEVVRAGMELPALTVAPGLLDVIFPLGHDGARVPVVFLARNIIAALQEKETLSGKDTRVCQGSAPRTEPGHGSL